MATYDLTKGNVGNAAGSPAHDMITAVYDAAVTPGAAADVFQMIAINKGTFVHRVFYQVLTGDATQTVDIGDGTTVDGYFADLDVATTGATGVNMLALTDGTPNTVTGYSAGKYYTADDTIDLVVPAGKAWDTLKLKIVAEVSYMGYQA